MANLSREPHLVKTVSNVSAPVVQARRHSVDKTRVDIDTKQSVSRQQLHRRRGRNTAFAFRQSTMSRRRFSFFSTKKDADHTGGSMGEGSEPNLHRLTDKASIRPRTAQQSRIVVASRVPSNY